MLSVDELTTLPGTGADLWRPPASDSLFHAPDGIGTALGSRCEREACQTSHRSLPCSCGPLGPPQPFWSAASWHKTRPRHRAAQLLDFNRVLNTQRKLGAESALWRPPSHLLLHRPLPPASCATLPHAFNTALAGTTSLHFLAPLPRREACRTLARRREAGLLGGRPPSSLPPSLPSRLPRRQAALAPRSGYG